MKTCNGTGVTVRDCWEAEDSLVLGLEQVASCHGQILDGLVEDEDEDVKEKLKQSIEALDCPVDALSDQLERAVERIVAVEREDKGGKQNGGIDGVMGLLSGYIKDIMSSLDVLKAGLCNLSVEGEEGQDRGGDVLRDLAMADCLEENFNLMEHLVKRIVKEAKESALVDMSREDMSAMVKAARIVHVDWIEG